MKIVCISDTHSHHRRLSIPEADMIIHSGDITLRGELDTIKDFLDWYEELPIKHKIYIQGNHELGYEAGPKRDKFLQLIKNYSSHYLEDSSIEIEGIKIHGSPITPFYHGWEYNRQRGKDIKYHWDKIPQDTNILITHGPPFEIMDAAPRGTFGYENVGCADLADKIWELPNLKLHCFGHIHSSYGKQQEYGILFVNAAICKQDKSGLNDPQVVEI